MEVTAEGSSGMSPFSQRCTAHAVEANDVKNAINKGFADAGGEWA